MSADPVVAEGYGHYVDKPYWPHVCRFPVERPPIGSIWQCDIPVCLRYYVFRCTDDSWGPVWDSVRWWDQRIRKRIKEARP